MPRDYNDNSILYDGEGMGYNDVGVLTRPRFVEVSIACGSGNPYPSQVVTAPSDIQDGDLLLAFMAYSWTSGMPPSSVSLAGFTLYEQEAATTPESTTKTAWKVASSESGNYTFTTTGGNPLGITAAIIVFRPQAGQIDTRGTSNTHSTAAKTGTLENTWHLCLWTWPTSETVTISSFVTKIVEKLSCSFKLLMGDELLTTTTVPARTATGATAGRATHMWTFGLQPDMGKWAWGEEGYSDTWQEIDG